MIDRMPLLLEREGDTARLRECLSNARAGTGGVVLVAGEAGIGKTTFVRDFVATSIDDARVLAGICDPISTPRPLGPLIDAARDVAPGLARRLAAGVPRAEAFASALDLIDDAAGPVVFVVEDLHWADDATLDLFTFLARRLDDRPALLVATYRNDEVDDRHPLKLRLGDVRAHVVGRIELQPLTADAVAELAIELDAADSDVDGVHRITGGNPFFVTEVLAAAPTGVASDRQVPTTVREAVVSRAERLGVDARSVLDAASIVPGRSERWLLSALSGLTAEAHDVALDTCCELGLLRLSDEGFVEFRHELGRLAVEGALPIARAQQLHALALATLRTSTAPVGSARLAHHAAGADDGPAVLELAPAAAVEAASTGAHPDEVALLELTLRYAHLCAPEQLGGHLLRLGQARNVVGDFLAAHEAWANAAEVFEQCGDVQRHAEALVEQATAAGQLGRNEENLELLRRAHAVLGNDPEPSRAAALFELARCSEAMLAREPEPAETHGQRAMAKATSTAELSLFARAAIQSGISRCMAGDDDGLDRVQRGIDIARQVGDASVVAHGYTQIGSGYGELRRYDVAVDALRTGIDLTAAQELVAAGHYLSAWLARCELETGDWQGASRRASALLSNPRCVGKSRFVALVTAGWLRVRRGDPGVQDVLDEALDFARQAQHIQRMWPAAAVSAEYAWMQGRLAEELPVVREALEVAELYDYRPAIEELAHWLAVAEERPPITLDAATTPFGVSAAGRPDLAATAWDERGCPYEAAVARTLMGDPDSVRAAFDTFERLGARPMVERTAKQLRDLGARVPRGPNRSTRSNPHGLTDRELDVLALLPSGCTNAEIGQSLHISTKTAGHHVSRILTKLGASTRAEAAIEAHRLDLDLQD